MKLRRYKAACAVESIPRVSLKFDIINVGIKIKIQSSKCPPNDTNSKPLSIIVTIYFSLSSLRILQKPNIIAMKTNTVTDACTPRYTRVVTLLVRGFPDLSYNKKKHADIQVSTKIIRPKNSPVFDL